MTLAVVTIAHGRHEHLAPQQAGIIASSHRPDLHVVVAMDDPDLESSLDATPYPRQIVHVPREGRHLPLARARNTGARTALAAGATIMVFLDVDCIPSPRLMTSYAGAAANPATSRDLLCGPVTYLPPPPPGGYDLATLDRLGAPHAARPLPAAGTVERTRAGYDLFWSLSFAVSDDAWSDIGGFDEAYVGYGGEDTDFARRAEAAGTALAWVRDADAFHQHHPVSVPPIEHVDDIVRNASVFHRTWGVWPMLGWLSAFEARGLVRRRPDGSYEATGDQALSAGNLDG